MPRTRFWPVFKPLPPLAGDTQDLPPPLPPSQPLQVQLVTPSVKSAPSQKPPASDDASEPEERTDDFYAAWDKFLAVQPKRAKKTSRAVRKTIEVAQAAHDTPGAVGLAVKENAEQSYEQAAAACRAKVAAIVEECRRINQKYTDTMFNLDADADCMLSLRGGAPDAIQDVDFPPWVKRVEEIFEKPQFFIEGATANDVHQGNDGDCWFLASLMAIAARRELIEKLCVARDERVGVYGFVFCRDGEWIHEVIDDKLYLKVGNDDDLAIIRDFKIAKKDGRPLQLEYDDEKLKQLLQKGGEALYFSHCKSDETWLPLIEKAYAKAHGDYYAVEAGYTSEGIEDLTGGVGCNLKTEDIMDKDLFWREELMQVNKQYLFGASQHGKNKKGVVGGHAYAVLEAWEEGDLRLLKIRNPWGSFEWTGDWGDGSKLWTADMMTKLKHTFGDDGVFWMSYKDFLSYFHIISRVRLFDETWSVAVRWTCVNVPWATDYLDTYFEFTTTQAGPVVLVLAKPDNRYFQNLYGRYRYALHFRLYKQAPADTDEHEEEEEGHYIVRSMHYSGGDSSDTRNVSAELNDLAPGTYRVIFKITATRWAEDETYAETILKCAQMKRDKLLSVGRRFDYAHAKGNLRARERANATQSALEDFELDKRKMREARRRTRIIREQDAKRRKRIKEAMHEKNRAYKFKIWKREREEEEKEKKAAAAAGAAEQQQQETTTDTVGKEVGAADPTEGPADEQGASNAEATKVSDEATAEQSNQPVDPPVASSTGLDDGATAASVASDKQVETPADSAAAPVQSSELLESSVSSVGQVNKVTPAAETSIEPSTDPVAEKLEKLNLEETSAPVNAPSSAALPPTTDKTTPSEIIAPPSQAKAEDEFVYESESEPPAPMDDNDFEWDSDIDGPIMLDYAEATPDRPNPTEAQETIFDDDPWNAVCVVGLRVYSKEKELKVSVVEDGGDE